MNPFVKCTKFCINAKAALIFKDIDEYSHREWCCHEKCEYWAQNKKEQQKEDQK